MVKREPVCWSREYCPVECQSLSCVGRMSVVKSNGSRLVELDRGSVENKFAHGASHKGWDLPEKDPS